MSDAPTDRDWRGVFCPRDDELRRLRVAYDRVAMGEPQIVALIANSGFGKTRLIHEFFHRLSTEIDKPGGEGYWPDRLGMKGKRLAVTPDIADVPAKSPMPFMWWGMTCQDAGDGVVGRTVLSADHEMALLPHLEPMLRSVRLRQRLAEIGKMGRAETLDLAKDLLEPFVPGIGLAKKLIERGWELGKLALGQRADATLGSGPKDAYDQRAKTVVDGLLADIRRLMGAASGTDRVPLVLIVDDAQFGRADETLTNFIGLLMREAVDKAWPVMLVLGHWESDWRSGRAGGAPGSIAHKLLREDAVLQPYLREIELGRIHRLDRVVAAAFPGLTARQNAMLSQKADGNGRMLEELILHLAKGRYFEGKSSGTAFTEAGEAEISRTNYSFHDLVHERLTNDAPPDVRRALSVAALHGMRFVPDLVTAICAKLDLCDGQQGLELAVDPHGFADPVGENLLEFGTRTYRDVALAMLADDAALDSHAIVAATAERLSELFSDRALIRSMSRDVREELHIIAANLFSESSETLHSALASFALGQMGDSAARRGDIAGAGRRYEAALSIAERLAASDPSNTVHQRDLSISYHRIGDMRRTQGDLPGALKRFEAGLAISARLAAADASSAAFQHDLLASHDRIGDVRAAQGDLPGALKSYETALEIPVRLVASDPSSADHQRDMSVCYYKIGGVKVRQGDLPGALKSYEAALAIRERLAAADPSHVLHQSDLAASYHAIGDVNVRLGDLPGALKGLASALTIRERLAAADPSSATYASNLSVSYNRIGDVKATQGDLPGGQNSFEAALAIRERLAAADPSNADYQWGLAISSERLGSLLLRQDKPAEALAALEACLSIYTRLIALDPSNLLYLRAPVPIHYTIGREYEGQGDKAAAARSYKAGMAIAERLVALRPDHPRYKFDVELLRAPLARVEG